MKRAVIVGILVWAAMLGSARPAAAGLWDWMQEWSGPGPFTSKTKPPIMVNFCPDDYRIAEPSPSKTPKCLYFDVRYLDAEANDNFPVKVSVTMVDVGITNKLRVWRLRDSVELGYGLGFLHASSDAGVASGSGVPIGNGSLTRLTVTMPRLLVKPLLIVPEVLGHSDFSANHPGWRSVLSIPKGYVSGTLVVGRMDGNDLGVPTEVRQYSENLEYLLSRGVFLDFGELFHFKDGKVKAF